jgi:hypothetical protein
MTEEPFDPDHLGNLMIEYSQDYFEDYGDERLAFQAFLDYGNLERTEGALNELTRLDKDCQTEATLEEALVAKGLCILMTGGETPYRDFVARLRGWLAESLADPNSQRRTQS